MQYAYEIYKDEVKFTDKIFFAQIDYSRILENSGFDNAQSFKNQYLELTETITNSITEEEQKEHLEKYKGLNPVQFLEKLGQETPK